MRYLHDRAQLALIGLLVFVVASGSIDVEFTSEFQRSGPAIHTLSVVIPREQFDAAEAAGQTAAFDEIASDSADAGLQASKIVTPETVTLRVSVERPDGEDAGAALNSLLNATGINQEPGIIAPFSGYYRQEGAAVGGSTFVLDLTIDGAVLYELVEENAPGAEFSRDEIESEVSITYEVSVPGELQDSTGVVTGLGTVLWKVDPGQTVSTRTEASAGDSERAALFVVAGLLSAAAVVVLAALIGWILVRRPRLVTSISSAATHFPRRTTITSEGLWVSNRIRQFVERFWRRGAPDRQTPIQIELLTSEQEPERSEDGADAEGN